MKIFVCTLFISLFLNSLGQELPSTTIDFEKLADDIFPSQDLDLNYSELYENLAQIQSNPLDLNTVNEEQLKLLYILSENQTSEFFRYRATQTEILSLYELQTIPGFDQATINKLIPFITLNKKGESYKSILKRILHEKNNYLILRYARTLEQKRGFQKEATPSSEYLGSPDNYYARFRVARSNDFSVGFTLEKDPGELFDWSSNQFGFDYTSAHIQIQNKGMFKNVVIGDFQAQFGQGLALGGGFGVGKGAEPITTIRRSNLGFLPYTSLNELGFLRGLSFTLIPFKNISISGFVSRIAKDGNTARDSTGVILSSLLTSGLHRTQAEIENRKSVIESNYGVVFSYKRKTFEAGVITHQTMFSIPIQRSITPYNQFFFNGNKNTNLSFYVNYSWQNFAFFGEASKTINHGKATVAGLLSSVTPQLDLSLMYRGYDPDFYSFYGNALSENTSVQNENGYYMGWRYKFNSKHDLAGYVDLFEFPWLRFRGFAPSSGTEWLLRYSINPSKQVRFFVQLREESKIRNYTTGNLYETGIGTKRNFWINADYEMSPTLNFKSRLQFSTYGFRQRNSSGFTIIQDVNFKIKRLAVSTRYALFDTEDNDNRQYAYERDVWLAYSFPFYSGRGIRSYILMQYSLSRHIDFWIRWARTSHSDRNTIGTGGETIESNSRNDFKCQVRVKL